MIKNKDGTPYQLERPNKLGASQAFFPPDKIILHNCHWDDMLAEDEDNLVPIKTAFSVQYQEKLKRAARDIGTSVAAAEPEVEEPPEINTPDIPIVESVEEEEPEEEKPNFEIPKLKYTVLFHCLPAIVSQHRDNLYGESFARLKYGKKFIFPGVIVKSSDLAIEFWTTDPKDQVVERSIVYPYRYENGIPYDDYRWWRIMSRIEKDGGYIYEAVLSDSQPDFSD
jgi:hypothetical protein